MLLDGHVGEVNEHVVQLTGARGVFDRAETAKSQFVPDNTKPFSADQEMLWRVKDYKDL